MILAAGLTPAWQQVMRFDRFLPGEVNRAREVRWCASGKVLNVGLALHHLRAQSQTLALVGGETGRAIQREFVQLGVPFQFVSSSAPTRVCTTILDQSTGQITELVANAATPAPEDLAAFQAACAENIGKASSVVLTGSLPAGTPAGFYRDLLRQTQARAILDIRGDELLHALEARPYLVKPNREELELTVGRKLSTDDQLVAAMQELNRRGATWVVVSQGKNPLWACGEGCVYRVTPPHVAVVNPIGCGDCLAAGLAWGVDQGMEVIDALRFGVAAAAENACELLPARLSPALVRQRATEVVVAQRSSASSV